MGYNIQATYDGQTLINSRNVDSSAVLYNGSTIIDSFTGNKVLNCTDKYFNSNVRFGDKTLLTEGTVTTKPIFLTSELARVYLYNNGDTCSAITGGYISPDSSGSTDWMIQGGTITHNADNMVCFSNVRKSEFLWVTRNKIDVTNFSRLVFVGNNTLAHPASYDFSTFMTYLLCTNYTLNVQSTFLTNPVQYWLIGAVQSSGTYTNNGTFTQDISGLTGEYYIGGYGQVDGGSVSSLNYQVFQIYLEA